VTKLVQVPKETLRAKRSLREMAEAVGELPTSLLAGSFEAPAPLVRVQTPTSNIQVSKSGASIYLDSLTEGASRESGRSALRRIVVALAEIGVEKEVIEQNRSRLNELIFKIPWHTLDRALVAKIRAHLQETCAPASANHYLSCLRGALKACADAGQMTYEAMHRALSGAKRVKGSRTKAGRALDPEEVQKLFAQCENSAIGKRDAAMLTLLCACGMRVSEVATVKFKALKDDGWFSFVGKANKEREMWLSGPPFEHMKAWVKVRGTDPGLVILACDGKNERGLTRIGIYFRVVELAKRAGIEHISPHDLRRTFFTDILDREREHGGVDPFVVAELGGHDDVKTTMLYNRIKQVKKKEAMVKFHASIGKVMKTGKAAKKR
jgi:integrase/recombinase XerD